MLIDILHFPPVLSPGHPSVHSALNRRKRIVTKEISPQDPLAIKWPIIPLLPGDFMVGSEIRSISGKLGRVTYVTDNNHCVVEVVFCQEGDHVLCLYARAIQPHSVEVIISLPSIYHYQTHPRMLVPLRNMIFETEYDAIGPGEMGAPNVTVPLVMGEASLWSHAQRLLDEYTTGFSYRETPTAFQDIAYYEAAIALALVRGEYEHHPRYDIRQSHAAIPRLNPNPLTGFDPPNVGQLVVADPIMDEVSIAAFMMSPTQFSISAPIADALEAIPGGWLIRDYQDPYHAVLHPHLFRFNKVEKALVGLLQRAASLYLQQCSISHDEFVRRENYLLGRVPRELSSITMTRTCYDEVVITIDDRVLENRVTYYTSLIPLILATQSVGWYFG